MKKVLLLFLIAITAATGCKSIDIKGALQDAINQEKANKALPAQLQGVWEYKSFSQKSGDVTNRVTINGKDFKLETFDRDGKSYQTFMGTIKIVDNSKKFIAPHLSQMFQKGKNVTNLLQKGNTAYYKPFYYQELTDGSVKLSFSSGYTSHKYLYEKHDESKGFTKRYELYNKK